MSMQSDVRTVRNHIENDLSTERAREALEAFNRIEEALPKPQTMLEQFEAYPIGTVFEIKGLGMQFVKVGERAMVRSTIKGEGALVTEYYDNMFTENVYGHWAWMDTVGMRIVNEDT